MVKKNGLSNCGRVLWIGSDGQNTWRTRGGGMNEHGEDGIDGEGGGRGGDHRRSIREQFDSKSAGGRCEVVPWVTIYMK